MARPKGSLDKRKRGQRPTPKADALVGTKIGRWSVLEKILGERNIKFKVICDCGTEKILPYSGLYNSLSCGCRQSEITSKRQMKPDNIAAKVKLFNSYKNGALARNHSFDLTIDQIMEICVKNCYYCDTPPANIRKTAGGQITINGIDRVDAVIGYSIENCVPCCKDCNLKKGRVTKQIIERAYGFFKK